MNKKKIIIISDHALSHSGVATQTKFLIEGLIKKGDMTFRQLGAGINQDNFDTIKVSNDFYIKPINGFGNVNIIRNLILNESPDAIIIFQDPRFFKYLFEIEEEIRQVCPILWWHVWDNYPFPEFNRWMLESVDTINCHSYMTYDMYIKNSIENVNYIPHALPEDIFYNISKKTKNDYRKEILKEKADWFNLLWVNRNIKRKRPGDLLIAFKCFLEKLYKKYNHKKANLLLHADPLDEAGINLLKLSEHLDLDRNIIFSDQIINNSGINILHNITDCCINISHSEGFGLSTLQSLQTGTPIVAMKTGGLTRQVVDFNNNFEYGVGIDPSIKLLNGNQDTHYIYEDYASTEEISDAIMKFYELSDDMKNIIQKKSIEYVKNNFNYNKIVEMWHKSIIETIDRHKNKKEINVEEV